MIGGGPSRLRDDLRYRFLRNPLNESVLPDLVLSHWIGHRHEAPCLRIGNSEDESLLIPTTLHYYVPVHVDIVACRQQVDLQGILNTGELRLLVGFVPKTST